MKKNVLFFLALSALCLGACSNNEGNEGNQDEDLQSTFTSFILKYQQPKLNFDLALYKMYDDDAVGWPFKESDEAIRIGQWRASSQSVRYLNYLRASDFLVSVYPGTHYSYLAFSPNQQNTVIDDTHLLDEAPTCPVSTVPDEMPDDFWYAYIKDYEAPSGKKDYEKVDNEKLGKISVETDTLVFTPATKPYQIEIIDPSGQMMAVEDIVITGFANGMDLITGEADKESCEMYIESAMPVKAVSTVAENGQHTFLGHVAAVKFRTWGRAGKSNIDMSFVVVANEKDHRFNVSITNNVWDCPDGGVISITFPAGGFN